MDNFTGVYKFTATWCQPCKNIQNGLLKNMDTIFGNIHLLKEIDVDVESMLTTHYGVTAMPTIVFVINGVEQKHLRIEGADMDAIVKSLRAFSAMPLNQNWLPTSNDAIVQCQQPNNRQRRQK